MTNLSGLNGIVSDGKFDGSICFVVVPWIARWVWKKVTPLLEHKRHGRALSSCIWTC
ncbi:MAG: hypothetical protein QXR69_02855 [Conexivisphaerales archaeon]